MKCYYKRIQLLFVILLTITSISAQACGGEEYISENSITFRGANGPWEHVSHGDASPPVLVLSNLEEGQLIKIKSITGEWSGRNHQGVVELLMQCNPDSYASFYDDHRNLIQRVRITNYVSGVIVPSRATKLYAHVIDQPFAYFDNDGNRAPNIGPCRLTMEIYNCYPECSDGIDNDGDGFCDTTGAVCTDGSTDGDLGCTDPNDDDESGPFNDICDGMVSYYELENDYLDSVGDNNGAAHGDPQFVAGIRGSGADFDGDDAIVIPYSDSLHLEEFTVSTWIKADQIATNSKLSQWFSAERNYVFSWDHPWVSPFPELSKSIALYYDPDNNWGVVDSWHGAIETNNLNADQWYNFVGTYDGNLLRLYIDGVFVDQEFIGNPPYMCPASIVTIGSGHICDAVPNFFFEGIVDEVGVWYRALNDSEIKTIYDKIKLNMGYCDVIHDCQLDQTIVKLKKYTDSTAALWDYDKYSKSICYPDFFGGPYTGSDPHPVCDATNSFLWLDTNSDSLVSVSEDATYDIGVCYDNLICHDIDTNVGESCNPGEVIIASLSAQTDAKISKGDDSLFPIKICCGTTGPVTNADLYWTNMDGEKIGKSAGINANVGTDVIMVAENLVISGNVIFQVRRKNTVGSTVIKSVNGKMFSGNIAKAKWEIRDSDLKTNSEDFFFTVVTVEGESDELTVLNSNDYDSSIDTEIIRPENWANYTVCAFPDEKDRTGNIPFEQITTSPASDVDLTWYFGDGTTRTFPEALFYGIGNTTHQYVDQFGTILVSILAKQTRAKKQQDIDRRRILLHTEGINIYAIIDEPKNYATLPPGSHTLDGRSSWVANCSFTKSECDDAANQAGKLCYNFVVNKGMPDLGDGCTGESKLYCYPFAGSDAINFTWIVDGKVIFNKVNHNPRKVNLTGAKEHKVVLKVGFTY